MQKVQVIGHRGNKAAHIENTLQGFNSVFTDRQIDGVELDVVVSKDKQLFVSHDMYAKHGKESIWHHQSDYQQILDAEVMDNGKYPLLEQVFGLYNLTDSNHKIQIEIKSDPSVNLPLSISQLISAVQQMIHSYNLLSNVSITSFDYRYITESKRQDSRIKTGLIMHRCLLPIDSLISLKTDAIVFEKKWITKDDIKKLDNIGVDSYVWTANSELEWATLKDTGITGIITDRPEDLVNWLREQ